MLRKLVLLLLIAIVLAVGALAAIPLFVNIETARQQIVAQVEDQTGMILRLDGEIAVAAFPHIAVSARSVGLSPSRGEDEILEAGEVRFGLKLMPLFGGRFELASLTLVEPEYTTAAGKGAEAEPRQTGDGDSLPVTSAELRRLQVDRLGIERGRLTIAGDGQGEPTVIDNINLTGALASPDEPTEIRGSFGYAGTDHRFAVTLDSLARFVDQGGSAASIELETDDLRITGTGNAWRLQGGSFDGRLTAEVKSVDTALQAYGRSPLALPWLSPVTVETEIVAAASGFRLSGLKSSIGDMNATGDVSLIIGGVRPQLAAILAVDRIDLAKIGAADDETADGDRPAAGNVSGPSQLDLSPLNLMDAEARLTIGTLENRHATLSDIDTLVRVGGGELHVELINAGGLGGAARASLELRPAADGSAEADGSVALDGIDVEQALGLADVDAPVRGSVSTDLEFAASGGSLDALRQSLGVRGTVSLRDGSVSDLGLAEHFSGDPAADRVSDLSVTARISGLDSPLAAEGSGSWRGLAVSADITADVNALMAGRSSDLKLDVRSSLASLGYTGRLSPKGLDASGTVSLQTPSLVRLAEWAGRPIGVDSGLENFAIRGKLAAGGERIAFSDATLSVDGSRGSGSVEADISGAVPRLTGRLTMQTLDLTPYLGSSSAGGGRGTRASGGSSGWSDAPIDLSGLGAVNADFRLAADQMIWDRMKTGQTAIDLTIEQRVLSADLTQLELYGGTGKGRFDLRADGDSPSFNTEFDLAGLSLFSFLRDAAGFERLGGAGAIRFALNGSGRSQRQFAQSLAGNAAIDFRDGAIRGINIPMMVRNLTSGALLGWQASESQSTDFSSLTASFTVDRGQAETSDLSLIGPLARLTGAGTVNVPEKTLSFKVDPRVVANLEGQGGQSDLAGLGVPVVIDGPWAKPRIYPDIEGILSDPQVALERLQNSGSALFNVREGLPANAGEAAGSLLNTLLGGGSRDRNAEMPRDTAPPPAQAGSPVAALPESPSVDDIGALIGGAGPVPLPRSRPDVVPSIQPVSVQPAETDRRDTEPFQPSDQSAGRASEQPADQSAGQATTEERPDEPVGQAIDLLQNLLR